MFNPIQKPALSQGGMFSGILNRLNPFPAGLDPDAGDARAQAILMAGLGMLAGNQGNYGATLPALAQGGMAGLQGYRNALKEQGDRRLRLLQEKLVGSQIAENDSQALLRKTKMTEEERLRKVRQNLITELDNFFGTPSAPTNTLGDTGTPRFDLSGDAVATGPGDVKAPQVNVMDQDHWSNTSRGNRIMATRLQAMGDLEGSKEYADRAEKLARLEFDVDKSKLEKQPEKKLTLGAPTGGNEQWDYIYDPDKKAKGPRLEADPRYVLAGKRQAVSNTTFNNIPAKVQEAGQVEMAKLDAKNVDEWRKKRADASLILPVLTRMEKATQDGRTYSGTFAEFKTGFGKLLNSIGVPGVNIDKIASSEQYAADQAEVIRTKIKALGSGTGVSNVDLLFTQRSIPELVKTAEGRMQIIKAMKADLQNIVDDAKDADRFFRENKGSLGGWEPPSAKKNKILEDESLDDLIKRNLRR